MRALTIVFAFSALAVVFLFVDRVTSPGDRTMPMPASAEALSIAEALIDRAGLAVMGIVLGPRKDGERDFRGLHSTEGRMRPVYGRVRVVCTGRAVGPACWEISYLEIDGQKAAHRVTARATSVEPSADRDEEEIETADTGAARIAKVESIDRIDRMDIAERVAPRRIPFPATGARHVDRSAPVTPERSETSTAPDMVAETPGPAGTGQTPGERTGEVAGEAGGKVPGRYPVPAARPLPVSSGDDPPANRSAGRDGRVHMPTHTVARPIINGRNGPGTDSPVIARLPQGMRLSLIDRRDDWGRFVILDGTASGREVWAALHILKQLP